MTNDARCFDCRDFDTTQKGCAICKRLAVERRIVKKTVSALLNQGFLLAVDQLPPTMNRKDILAAMMEHGDDRLIVYRGTLRYGWVWFVYGNDGWDVISDHTTNLETVLEPIYAFTESMAK